MALRKLTLMTELVLGLWLPIAASCQGDNPVKVENQSACGKIEALENGVRLRRQQLALAQQRYADDHPVVQAYKTSLLRTESAIAEERARAASQGLGCARAQLQETE
jgi:hypothetical protein